MKKIILVLVALMVCAAPLSAQTKQELKQAKKEAKSATKTALKEGWTLLESGDLGVQIQRHLAKKYSGDAFEISISVDGKKSINMAKSQARNNILNEYAESARSMVKGRVTSDMSDINDVQRENFLASYERLVCSELNGEVKTSYTLYRKNKDGKFDVKLVTLVDCDAAHQAHIKAMKRALEEQEMAQKYGSKISDWINEGFAKACATN